MADNQTPWREALVDELDVTIDSRDGVISVDVATGANDGVNVCSAAVQTVALLGIQRSLAGIERALWDIAEQLGRGRDD